MAKTKQNDGIELTNDQINGMHALLSQIGADKLEPDAAMFAAIDDVAALSVLATQFHRKRRSLTLKYAARDENKQPVTVDSGDDGRGGQNKEYVIDPEKMDEFDRGLEELANETHVVHDLKMIPFESLRPLGLSAGLLATLAPITTRETAEAPVATNGVRVEA